MIQEKSIRRKDILVGLGIGVGVGLFVLISVLLLLRPDPELTPTLSPTLTFAVLPTVTGLPEAPFAPPEAGTPTPEAALTPTPTVVTQYVTYTVKSGDTLSGIAYGFGISVDALRAANDITGDIIQPDQELRVPLTADIIAALTATPAPAADAGDKVVYEVKAGDTLGAIAKRYGVTVAEITAANALGSDIIQVGQKLVIPLPTPTPTETPTVTPTPTTTPTPTVTPTPTWAPALLENDLGAAYPETSGPRRFTLHYRVDAYPAQDIASMQALIIRGLTHIEGTFHAVMSGAFDVYVAGTLFAAPDMARRGRTFEEARQVFILRDGTGDAADQQYVAARELTHLFTRHVFGPPASPLLREGIGVSIGMSLLADSDHIPLATFCAAYQRAGKLPRPSANLRFENDVRDLPNYYAAGCFVQYLLEMYGTEKFGQLYPTGDYKGVYEKSLATLEAEWLAALETAAVELPFAPEKLVAGVTAVNRAYETLFNGFRGTEAQMARYRTLDAARLALLTGDFATVDQKLAEAR